MMPRFLWRDSRAAAGFSLVEVTLALGVIGFALVGIIGALPVAMDNERVSIEQARAAGIANSVFATLRCQPFTKVKYLDAADSGGGSNTPASIDLSSRNDLADKSPPVVYYVAFSDPFLNSSSDANSPVDVVSMRSFSDKSKAKAYGVTFQVVMKCRNQPDGMYAAGMANSVELSIGNVGGPVKQVTGTTDLVLTQPYRFTSVIANRGQ